MILIKNNYNLQEKSFIHVGGVVNKYVECNDVYQTINFLKNEKKYIALGNTSKCLFCFDYSPLTYFCFLKKEIFFFKDRFFVYSGISLSYLNQILTKNNITGFEYLSTIPGLIGGSIFNNASFLNQEISSLLIKILVYDGNLYFIDKKEIDFGYRKSGLKKENFIILGAYFYIKKDSKKNILKKYEEAKKYRQEKQRYMINTLGSTFKNLDDIVIGKTLDCLGFKGFYLNNSCKVSEYHANFIIIKKYSNYKEIYSLIQFLLEVLYNELRKRISLEIQIFLENGREEQF